MSAIRLAAIVASVGNRMNCIACGTRTGGNVRNCPNCGRTIKAQASRGGAASNEASSTPLEASSAQAPTMRRGASQSQAVKPQRKSRATKKAQPAPELEEITGPELATDGAGLGHQEIRALIHDQPDRIEDGLSIFTNANAEPVGIDYQADVGSIDLLAVDDAGGLVAVMVPGRDELGDMPAAKDLVSGALERVGWIRKHIAEQGQEVRALVLLDGPLEDLGYAAAAVAQTVSFKTYRLELSFSDLDA